MFTDIFNDDAFSLVELTAVINNIDHVPGRAGELVFAGVGEGVSTLTVSIESKGESLSLIPTSPRGAPAPKEKQDKASIRAVSIPQIKLEDTIGAHQIIGVRQFGSTDQLRGAQTVVNGQITKMTRRHDLTIEHLRLGALNGNVLDADGSVLVNLFTLFGVQQETDPDFSEVLAAPATEESLDSVRTVCMGITRSMKRNIKAAWPSSANIWCFAGDNFFDRLIEATTVKGVWDGWAAAERRLGDNYAFGIYEFGGIMFENYQGTDDNSTVAVDPDTAIFFPVGVPGLYAEYFAPADFLETVNTVGLPRYAKIAPDNRFNQYVELHTQQNPMPLCLRPKVLMRSSIGTE